MTFQLKKHLPKSVQRHLPAVINPDGHMPPVLKRILLSVLRLRYKKTFNGLYIVNIMFGPLKGKKMILNLDPDNGAVNTEYLAGYRQEREEIEILKKLDLKDKIIWDIGIYRGFYTLLFSEQTGTSGKVIAFDLEEKNCKVVNEISRLNNVNNISVYNYGISNDNVESDFISSPSSNSRLMGTFRGTNTDSTVLTKGESINRVKLRTLNSLVDELGHPDIIKMDIDGAELFALDTADKVFENEDAIFIIESHNKETDHKITEFFNRNKCFVYSINENRFFNSNDLFGGNTIGCKRKDKLDVLFK